MENTTNRIFLLIIILLLIWALALRGSSAPHVDSRTIETCRELEKIRTAEFQGTQWENMDFFKSCVENVAYTSGLKERTLDIEQLRNL